MWWVWSIWPDLHKGVASDLLYHYIRLVSVAEVISIQPAVVLLPPPKPATWRPPSLSSSASAWCRASTPWSSTGPPEPWYQRRHQRCRLPASSTCPPCQPLKGRRSARAIGFMAVSTVVIITLDGAERRIGWKIGKFTSRKCWAAPGKKICNNLIFFAVITGVYVLFNKCYVLKELRKSPILLFS